MRRRGRTHATGVSTNCCACRIGSTNGFSHSGVLSGFGNGQPSTSAKKIATAISPARAWGQYVTLPSLNGSASDLAESRSPGVYNRSVGDLAEQRMSLVHERALARRSIATGAALLASIVLVIGLSVFMTDTVLLVASVYILLALIFGTRWFVYGVLMHGV